MTHDTPSIWKPLSAEERKEAAQCSSEAPRVFVETSTNSLEHAILREAEEEQACGSCGVPDGHGHDPDCTIRNAGPRPNEAQAPFATLTETGLDDLMRELIDEPWTDRKLAVLTLIQEVRHLRGLPLKRPEDLTPADPRRHAQRVFEETARYIEHGQRPEPAWGADIVAARDAVGLPVPPEQRGESASPNIVDRALFDSQNRKLYEAARERDRLLAENREFRKVVDAATALVVAWCPDDSPEQLRLHDVVHEFWAALDEKPPLQTSTGEKRAMGK